MAVLRQRQGEIQSDSSNRPGLRLDDGFTIPIAREGLKILGCLAGANAFCAAQLNCCVRTLKKI